MNGELAQVQSGGLYLKSSILTLSDTYQAMTQCQNDVGYNDEISKGCGVENEAIHTNVFLIKDHGTFCKL
jgi:hypothetical protein